MNSIVSRRDSGYYMWYEVRHCFEKFIDRYSRNHCVLMNDVAQKSRSRRPESWKWAARRHRSRSFQLETFSQTSFQPASVPLFTGCTCTVIWTTDRTTSSRRSRPDWNSVILEYYKSRTHAWWQARFILVKCIELF